VEDFRTRILLIEDDQVDRMAFGRFVRSEGLPYDYACAGSVAEAKSLIASDEYDVIVMDFVLGDGTALDLFEHVPDKIPIVVVTGGGDEETAVLAMKAGASDYVIKDTYGKYLKILPVTVSNAIKSKKAEIALQEARDELEKRVEERTAELQRVNEQLRQEVSERKKAEAALLDSRKRYKQLYQEAKRSEEIYRSLLDSTPNAVMVYDLEGNVQYVNESFASIFGWSRKEVKAGRVPYLPDSERESTVAGTRAVLDNGVSCRGFETKRYTKDGTVLDVSISASRYLDHEGKPAGMIVILSDITEQKRLQDQLRQASKMEAIGQLAGGVAHDFNNLLTAMMGYSNMLLQKIPRDADYREQVYQISRAAERAASLTRQLLAFGRKQNLELKVINLNSAIAEFAKILGRLIGENIELVTSLDESLALVEADPSQVEQILMNLAVNARDAMPGTGCLTLETGNVVLDEEYARSRPDVTAGEYVRIAISDNGCGMDGSTVSRIFDPFFTTKEKGVGTGLGLSTVYGIVKQHRGHLAVYSEPGRGTTFKVYLPAADHPSEMIPEPTAARSDRHGAETVLLVEDEEIVRNLASEVLEMLGYRVLTASNPYEALKVSRECPDPIDLLLTDVVLPKMDGKTLFTLLSPQRPEMSVLYVSGYTEGFIVQHGVLLPGVHFLQKPFTVTSLSAKVREVLDQPRGTRQ
jgi:PAS domain S-box-containing protein